MYFDPAEAQKRARFYIVFTDVFMLLESYKSPLLTKAARALKYRVVATVPLKTCKVSDVNDGSGYLGVTAWNSIQLQSQSASYYFFMKSVEEKREVLELLNRQVAALNAYE